MTGPIRRTALLVSLVVLTATAGFAADNPRLFVTDSSSWEVGGGGVASDGVGAGSGGGGARPQTAEIIKTFHERCPNAIINNRRDKADYVVQLDHEGGKSPFNRDNKIVVFHNTSGDAIFTRSTRSLGNSVKDACTAIYRDFSRRAAVQNSNRQVEANLSGTPASSEINQTVAGTNSGANVRVTSTIQGAEVEIDGRFVGSTPSTILLKPGDHTVVVRKNGYAPWQRTVTITGGDINLVAELVRQ